MSVNRYEKSLTDEALQTPPKSVKEKAKPSAVAPGADVIVSVERVEGCCPEFIVEGDEIKYVGLEPTSLDHVCPFAQAEYYQYMSGLSMGVSAEDLGISCGGEDGFVCCGAWGNPSCEAKVVFRLHPEPIDQSLIDYIYEYLARGKHHCTPEFFRETFSDDETIQQRENLMKEWDEAGRPLFWDKWNPASKLMQSQIEGRKKGISDSDAVEAVLGRPSRLIGKEGARKG